MSAANLRRCGERGLTLTEVAVVMILGSMITAGLVGFYMSSQSLWLDGSTQAITQREATLVASAIRDSVHRARKAVVSHSPDAEHMQLALYCDPLSNSPSYYFYWSASDSLIHAGPSPGGPGAGPIGSSRATRLQFIESVHGVRMDLRLLTATGSRVDMGAYAVFKN